jgi:dipeptidyl aminopeptidase/acylaminoacyl peptidase
MTDSLFIKREIIELNDAQTKMLISGWGKEVYQNTIVEKITYVSDKLKVNGYIAYPCLPKLQRRQAKENEVKKFPCIIWNRGGYENKGTINRFNARGIFGQIASWGYIVFASQYRGNDGGEGKEEMGGKDVNDVLNLMPLADELPFADKGKWGIEGWSRGGMMTFLTLKQNKNFSPKGGYASGVRCAVLVGAISDFKMNANKNPDTKKYYSELIGGKNIEEEINKRSAITFAEHLPKIPYLILHGLADEDISPLQSIELSKKFYELNIPHRLVLFENGDHYLKKHRKEVNELRKMWFEKYLKS